MKERFGAAAGTAIHVIAYTLAPMIVGATLLRASLKGAGG